MKCFKKSKLAKSFNLLIFFYYLIEVPWLARKAIGFSKPTIEITIEDDVWTILTLLPIKTIKSVFKLGEKVVIENPMSKGDVRNMQYLVMK